MEHSSVTESEARPGTCASPAPVHAAVSQSFQSVLFEDGRPPLESAAAQPDFFRDLSLDQIVEAITATRRQYNLKPFFHTPLTNPAAVAYRHEIMHDLENEALFQCVGAFSRQMRSMHDLLAAAEKSYCKHAKEAWFLAAAETYGEAVVKLLRDLEQGNPRSRGLRAFRGYLAAYTGSGPFTAFLQDTRTLKAGLSAVRYCLLIRSNTITVRNYDDEMNYSAAVEETFARFKQGSVEDYLVKYPDLSGMGHIEAMVLERVAWLNPDVFTALEAYCRANAGFLDKKIAEFDREIQFYTAYLEYMEPFKRAGLKFCYPHVSQTSKQIRVRDAFDLALAANLLRENAGIVCNDFHLDEGERIFVVTGPNQGGKTTFARLFGQMHYLASLGCPVPGTEARLFLFDRLFTHFERAEDISTLRGKLEDDLVRIRDILERATPDSIVIINEIFSSTTLKDAVYLGRKILERLCALDALCVCVTFLDELSSLNEKTVSAVAAVAPEDPTLRTYKIERRPADGLSYALAIAQKHHLTYGLLKERLQP